MKNNILQTAKGVRDFLPEEKMLRDNVVNKLIKVFEKFAFNPLETSVIERYELFASKFSQGEESEAVQEGFKLTDRAKRELILRTEFTAPLARVFATHKTELKLPFKRYQIGKVFRDGPLKAGRYREFYQADVDILGIKSTWADVELMDLTLKAFEDIGFANKIEVLVNSRKLLNAVLKEVGIVEEQRDGVIISVDKLEKIGKSGVVKECLTKGIEEDKINKVLDILGVSGSNQEKIEFLKTVVKDVSGINEIEEMLKKVQCNKDIVFSPSLARGLGYYTGNIFEVIFKDKKIMSSSIAGGGRYDKMIGDFLGEENVYPAIGISFGIETIIDILKLEKEENIKKNIAQIYSVALDEKYLPELVKLVRGLQTKYKCDINYNMKPFKKALDYANKQGIQYVLILGENEAKDKTIVIKDMEKGEQKTLNQKDLLNEIDILFKA